MSTTREGPIWVNEYTFMAIMEAVSKNIPLIDDDEFIDFMEEFNIIPEDRRVRAKPMDALDVIYPKVCVSEA